jgi:hypothetical protein
MADHDPTDRAAAAASTALRGPGHDEGALCRQCGLCCDGTLFGRGRLEPEERDSARKRGLAVLDSSQGLAFEQPCAALADRGRGERACAVYTDRPGTCRRFVCRLYVRHRDEGGPLEPYLAAVERTKQLLGAVAKDRGSPDRAELERRMAEDFARASDLPPQSRD